MKQLTRHLIPLLLILAILCAMLPAAFAATGALRTNTAVRHTPCTKLSAQAETYYTGGYSYQNLSHLHGAETTTTSYAATQNNELYTALCDLMSSTHTNQKVTYAGYSSNALATYWKKTDAAKGASTYLYFYTDIPASDASVQGVTMNREHVWPKSRASFYQTGGGSDLHHLRPSISSVNTAKSNNAFADLVGTGTPCTACKVNGQDVIWTGTKSGVGGTLEVRDNIKGDVARILLYVYVRWQQPNLYSDVQASLLPPMDKDDSQSNGLRVVESLDTLLEWMEIDPVDDWEMSRNDQIENVQGNRNVFIDYPELAWRMFSRSVPSGMSTPSGNADCKHNGAKTTQHQDAVCTKAGYDRIVCDLCGTVISDTVLPALGHNFADGICTRCGAADPDYKPGPIDPDPIDPDPVAHDCPCDDYSDLSSAKWYHKGVDYALNNGLMNGVGSGKFDPDGALTRAMLVTILYRSENEPDVGGMPNPFTDVSNGQWYTDAVIWAADKGIVNGTSATTFAPNANITREQIAAILYRYAGAVEVSGNLFLYGDVFSVSDYAIDAMTWAVKEGIINGTDGMLLPKDNATRAQIATILYRYLSK